MDEGASRGESSIPLESRVSNISSKKRQLEEGGGGSISKKRRLEELPECRKKHSDRSCLKGRNVCFRCWQSGHIATNFTSQDTKKCYICGEQGHTPTRCPKKSETMSGKSKRSVTKPGQSGASVAPSQPIAWTFNMTLKDVREAEDMVTGTLFVNSLPAYVLSDSGATKSFISYRLIHELNLKLKNLCGLLNVEVTSQETL